MSSKRRITVIAVGPLPNIGVALDREPAIAEKARFIGMHGSICKGRGSQADTLYTGIMQFAENWTQASSKPKAW